MAITALRILHAERLASGQQLARVRAGACHTTAGADLEALHKQLKRVFNAKPGKRYGRFSDDVGATPLRGWLQDYLAQRQPFERFSDHLCGHWKELLDARELDYSGHLMLVHEALADGEVLYLFGLETEAMPQLTPDLDLDLVEVLLPSRLELGLRIELSVLQDNAADNYLTLTVARGSADLGDAFKALSGFSDSVDVDQETRTFMDAVEAYARHSEPEKAGQVRSRAYDYCKDQSAQGVPVAIEALAACLDTEQPARFVEFVRDSHDLQPETVLHPDPRKVRKLVRISAKGNGISLSFSSDLFNQAVHYDRQQDALIITRLPRALKEQLEQYLASAQDKT